jgi:hypothetical protein
VVNADTTGRFNLSSYRISDTIVKLQADTTYTKDDTTIVKKLNNVYVHIKTNNVPDTIMVSANYGCASLAYYLIGIVFTTDTTIILSPKTAPDNCWDKIVSSPQSFVNLRTSSGYSYVQANLEYEATKKYYK